jgi:Tfp pilus assembly protein PilN
MLNMVFSWLFVNCWREERQVIRAEEVEEKWHPLLPAEKKLILYSLIAAVVLLVLLVLVSYTYFRPT